MHAVREEYEQTSSESDFIGCVTLAQPHYINAVEQCGDAKEIYAEMILGGQPVRFHIDCRATVNVLPTKYVGSKEIKPTKKVLQMWNKSELKPEGVTCITIRNPKNNKKYSVEFVVVKEELTPLLGAKASQHMGLLEIHPENFRQVANVKMPQSSVRARVKTADQLIKEYHDVFEGDLGTLPGRQRLEVDPSVTPTISPSRRVPLALKPRLKQELERLTSLRVIAPVDSPTDWVSNVVVATKPSGDLRICIDPKGLNKALKRERYPIPVIKDVLPELSKARIFTKVDARNGYWHVVLDEESAKLTTFDTPFGRYYWRRLPFGLSVSSEIFQTRIHHALDGLPGLLDVHDDIVIYGTGDTDEEANADHDKNLEKFLQCCRHKGVKLNKQKLKLKCTEFPYLGHLVTKEALKPDPDKIKAVLEMPRPDNIKAVRRFCGFVNYLAKFMPKLSEVMEPIRNLTCKESEWNWTHDQNEAFMRIKEMAIAAPLLKYYNPQEELTIQCDASERGLGAALLQKGRPVAFASRAMTETELRYAQIEKELLSVVFALDKFEQYAYGRPVTVQSDHKPLKAIAKKPLRCAPKRLQGMFLKIQKFDIIIVYKPGSQMYLADMLSRAYLPSTKNTQGDFEMVNALKILPVPQEKHDEILKHTSEDEVLQLLKVVILTGWPAEKKDLPAVLNPYYSYRDELAVYDGLIFRGECLVIPKALHYQTMKIKDTQFPGGFRLKFCYKIV